MSELNFLAEHRPHFGTAHFVSVNDLNPGDVVTFSYLGKTRYVLVTDPNWDDKLHGLTLEAIPHTVVAKDVLDALFKTDIPRDLYNHSIKQLIKRFPAYRTYSIEIIRNMRRIPYYVTDNPVDKKDGEPK